MSFNIKTLGVVDELKETHIQNRSLWIDKSKGSE